MMGWSFTRARARPWCLAAAALSLLLPEPWSVLGLTLAVTGWLLTRPPRSGRRLVLGFAGAVLALLTASALLQPPLAGDRASLAQRTRQVYAGIWAELDRLAADAARDLEVLPFDDQGRLLAFERLAQLLRPGGRSDLTLLLLDPDGTAVAWSGAGLLHEPEQWAPTASGRSHIAGYGAVTLLRITELSPVERPWRLVAGRSLSADRLPLGVRGNRSAALRWTVVDAGAPVKPGLLAIPLERAPTLLVETAVTRPAPPRAGGVRPELPAADRLRIAAALLLVLGLLVAAGRKPGLRPYGRWLRPDVGAGLLLAAVALGAGELQALLLVAGLGLAAFAAGSAPGQRRPGYLWGLLVGAVMLATGFGVQLASGPLDLGLALLPDADSLAARVALAGLAFALLAWRLPGALGDSSSGRRWLWLAIAALLAAAAAHDTAVLGVPLLLAGTCFAGRWAAAPAVGRGTTLATIGLLAALIAASSWELTYRHRLRSHLGETVLPLLGPPTTAELTAISNDVRRYLRALDLERLALQDVEALDRQDLAYELWHHSPLATRGVISALAVVPDQGPISTFAFGLPLTEEGRPDDSPLRRPDPTLPIWDSIQESGSVELERGGQRWGVVRFWLRPRPGFRLGALPLDDLAARMLRGGPFLRAPAEELLAPASFALFHSDGRPLHTIWSEAPRLGESLLGGGQGKLQTPDGAATVLTAAGREGVRALILPHLAPAAALERVGASSLSVLALTGLWLLLAAVISGGRRLLRQLQAVYRSFPKRLSVVYGLLLVLPVLLLSALFVRFMGERLERQQRSTGAAALESAQRVLGEYVLSLDTGFVIDTQLDNELLDWLAGVVRHDVNLYWGSTFYVSSKPELFTTGFLPKRIPGEIYSQLLLRGRDRAGRTNRVGGVDYLELYGPLRIPGVSFDRALLFLSVPLLAQQEEVAAEIASLRRRVALATSALLLLMVAVGARLGRAFTEPVMEIVRGTQEIAEGATSLAVRPADEELATLAAAIDRMATRIAEARQRLTREKKLVELMVENINAAVISLDREQRVVLHNRLAREMLGIGVGDPLALAPGMRPELAAVARFAGGAGSMARQQTIRLGGEDDDRARDWSLIWAPLPGEGDPAALLVVEDVTEVLRAQRLEAWAEMARIIAHEIKNPLTPIRLSTEHMTQVWRQQPDEFEQVFERCTRNILRQVEELQTIAMEFSTYSRIPRIERREDDLAKVVAGIVEAYGGAPAAAARVRALGLDGPLRLEFDARLVGRAVRNLIENALRASPEGAPVEVALEAVDGEAVIRVADRGPGVAAELLGKIFEPYFSTHDAGTGLGLPIARRIAEAHGGAVHARNRPGGGLEVSIHLPLAGQRQAGQSAG